MSNPDRSAPPPSFLRRLSLALSVLFSGELARRLVEPPVVVAPPAPAPAPAPVAAPAPVEPPPPPPPQIITLKEATPDAALQLLGLLQRDARLIDFVQEDITAYGDADIGAAARLVHEGCRKVLKEHLTLAPVRTESEGARITLPAGFDAAQVRLTGNVVGQAPFTGTLSHRGWKVTELRLPQLAEGHDASIVAQAEVEL
ncbi:hypothetical protein ABIC99_000968 [Sphaerotilus sulfidivorans]|uniref:DUF2760 domain-containing protein n=1 Tax=Sphaerotilus sulfidivorans TaxID=639200 RepID=A0A5C1PZ02_9BURK|nr:DUF2760 domain-containing protein [Sphaerotilus sulfidivorans]NZD46491.1 DUF2760 domain-containing protein [Sphaerotilus sulfidivorans]QEN00647.1 DUF2760 domain-containing protein [Sphaerotilus sulfidivorans]